MASGFFGSPSSLLTQLLSPLSSCAGYVKCQLVLSFHTLDVHRGHVMFRRPVESFYLRQEQHYDIYDYQGTICSMLNNLGVLGAVKNFKLSSRPLVASFASTSAVTAVTAVTHGFQGSGLVASLQVSKGSMPIAQLYQNGCIRTAHLVGQIKF